VAWILLIVAGLLESAWAVFLKYTDGFTRLWPTVGFVISAGASLYLLARALRELPLGTAYAVWTGIGAAATAVLGLMLLGESASPGRLLSIGLIIGGVFGLRVFAP
jgi:quaternary ammonium compound-resistance protein SugE